MSNTFDYFPKFASKIVFFLAIEKSWIHLNPTYNHLKTRFILLKDHWKFKTEDQVADEIKGNSLHVFIVMIIKLKSKTILFPKQGRVMLLSLNIKVITSCAQSRGNCVNFQALCFFLSFFLNKLQMTIIYMYT